MLQVLRERLDNSFEWSARELGVKAIWEDMKARAELSSRKQGAVALAAQCIAEARANLKLHLIGHSAGAILHGHFLGALSKLRVPIESCHLWAPACTVEFATETYGAAIAGGMLSPERMFIEVLSDANERGHFTVPGLYSKSLLYLVSRGLEPEHKTPILGLEMTLPTRREAAALQDVFSAEAIAGVRRWNEIAKGVVYEAPIAAPVVPTRLLDGQAETVDADHGSFDNSLDSFNRAIAGMLGSGAAAAGGGSHGVLRAADLAPVASTGKIDFSRPASTKTAAKTGCTTSGCLWAPTKSCASLARRLNFFFHTSEHKSLSQIG